VGRGEIWRREIASPLDVRSARLPWLDMAILSMPRCPFADTLELFLEILEVFVGQAFKINKLVSSAFKSTDNLIELQINRF
jgi:hypothetical protein